MRKETPAVINHKSHRSVTKSQTQHFVGKMLFHYDSDPNKKWQKDASKRWIRRSCFDATGQTVTTNILHTNNHSAAQRARK